MPKQAYETTIVYSPTEGMHFYAIPRTAFPNEQVRDINLLVQDFPMNGVIDVLTASDLARGLAALISADKTMAAAPPTTAPPPLNLHLLFVTPDPTMSQHIEHAAYARIVPFASSPLELESIAGIFTGAGAVAVGVKLGLLVDGGTTLGPVMLLSASAGVLVVCTAQAAGKELGRFIARKVSSWLGLSP
jgi:hypothetical protein